MYPVNRAKKYSVSPVPVPSWWVKTPLLFGKSIVLKTLLCVGEIWPSHLMPSISSMVLSWANSPNWYNRPTSPDFSDGLIRGSLAIFVAIGANSGGFSVTFIENDLEVVTLWSSDLSALKVTVYGEPATVFNGGSARIVLPVKVTQEG